MPGASLCFKKCPAGSRRTAVSTCVHDVKWRGNTHLYVVRGGLQLLAASSDPVAKKAVATMTTEPCKSAWEQGLWDADDPNGNLLDNPSDPNKGGGTHFYNASLKDAWGKPTKTVTYLLAGVQVAFKGNARTNAKAHLLEAGDLNKTAAADQCHALGLALHFETDMTQPMHATAFSALEIPTMLHAALEEYAPTIQARYAPVGAWDQRWKAHGSGQRPLPDLAQVGPALPRVHEAHRLQGDHLHHEPRDRRGVHRHVLRGRAGGGRRDRRGAARGLPGHGELHLRSLQPQVTRDRGAVRPIPTSARGILSRMKIAMMGSGGVGGFFGGRLAHAGYDVAFVARGAHLEAMRRDGLTLESEAQGDIRIPRVQVTDDPATLGPVDLVILSVKLWDTEAAARAIAPIVGPETGVLSLQNGVVKDDILRGVFAPGQVMGGVGYVATHISRPGVIHQVGTMQRIVLGEYDGNASERARFLHAALVKAGVNAELSGDVRRAIWEKYVFLVGLSATTTTMRCPLGPIRANPQARAFLLDVMREVVAVGRALGVALPADYAEAAPRVRRHACPRT